MISQTAAFSVYNSSAVSSQSDPFSTSTAAAPTSDSESFAHHLNRVASEDDDSDSNGTTEPVGHHRSARSDTADDNKREKKLADPSQSTVPVDVAGQHVQDARRLLLSLNKQPWNKQQDAAGSNAAPVSNAPAATAATTKAPIAFQVTLPKLPATGTAASAGKAAVPANQPDAANALAAAVGKNQHNGKGSSDSKDDGGSDPKQAAALDGKAGTPQPVANAPLPASPVQIAPTAVPAAYAAPTHIDKTSSAAPAAPTTNIADTAPTLPARTPQSIDLKVSGADNTQIDVRVAQRAGDVQVTVRTPDSELAQSLRQHLPDLSDRLAQSGIHGADVWSAGNAAQSSDTRSGSEQSSADDWQRQQQGGQQSQGQGQQARQQQNQQRQSSWLQQLSTAEQEG